MKPAYALHISLAMAAFFALDAYAATENWVLWRQTNSTMMNAHQNKKSIAAFNTETKCEAELEKSILTTMAQLKAKRAGNSVVYKAGSVTYSCLPEKEAQVKAFSKSAQHNAKQKSNSPANKQNF